jgi:hypothetical protein
VNQFGLGSVGQAAIPEGFPPDRERRVVEASPKCKAEYSKSTFNRLFTSADKPNLYSVI